MRPARLLASLLAAAAGLGAASCADDEATSAFCRMPARLVVDNVYQAPALYTACQSAGEFCSVTTDGRRLSFAGSKVTSELNINAMDRGFTLGGLATGLIVGLPSLPEMGRDESRVVCFDLACPNCHQLHGISKRLTLAPGGAARCAACGREYNLDNLGQVARGEAGRPLYRYRVSYIQPKLIVSN